MADDDFAPPSTRLMNFVSEQELSEARRARGARVEDGTAQRDRSLYEILKENKDKKDAEFNERFKHRPPKALDEDETEFLDKLEMSRREYEQQLAEEEAQQLQSFQEAVAAQSSIVHEPKETPPLPNVLEQKLIGKKTLPTRPFGLIIKVKPPAKKAKTETANVNGEEMSDAVKSPLLDAKGQCDFVKTPSCGSHESSRTANTGLVSYSDESEDD